MPATVYSDLASDLESDYVSGRSSLASNGANVHFTNPHLVFLNRQLQNLEPQGTSHVYGNLPKSMSNLVAW